MIDLSRTEGTVIVFQPLKPTCNDVLGRVLAHNNDNHPKSIGWVSNKWLLGTDFVDDDCR